MKHFIFSFYCWSNRINQNLCTYMVYILNLNPIPKFWFSKPNQTKKNSSYEGYIFPTVFWMKFKQIIYKETKKWQRSNMLHNSFQSPLSNSHELKFTRFRSKERVSFTRNVILQDQTNKQGSLRKRRNTMADKGFGSYLFAWRRQTRALLDTAREKGLTNISPGHGPANIGLKQLWVIP